MWMQLRLPNVSSALHRLIAINPETTGSANSGTGIIKMSRLFWKILMSYVRTWNRALAGSSWYLSEDNVLTRRESTYEDVYSACRLPPRPLKAPWIFSLTISKLHSEPACSPVVKTRTSLRNRRKFRLKMDLIIIKFRLHLQANSSSTIELRIELLQKMNLNFSRCGIIYSR